MTTDQFREWLNQHKACYPGLIDWIAKLPAERTDASPSRSDVMNSWYRTLRDVPFADAVTATHLLGTDEFAEPKGYGNHPKAIWSICNEAKKKKQREIPSTKPLPKTVVGPDGLRHTVYNCLRCQDTGIIEAWHPATMRAVREFDWAETVKAGKLYRVCVKCDKCDACAAAMAGSVAFDEKKMLRAPMNLRDPEALAELEAFCRETC